MNEPIEIDIYNNPLHAEIFRAALNLAKHTLMEEKDREIKKLEDLVEFYKSHKDE